MNSMEKPAELMTPAEVARRIGVSPITVRSWVAKGWLKSRVTPGGHRRYLWADVEQLMKQKGRDSIQPAEVKILVIDDDDQFRGYLISALLYILPDAQIREAVDGFQAGMMLAEFHPDLVLLDYAMPRINGAEVCRMIKSNPAYADIRVVSVTGFANDDIKNTLINAGADKVMLKPISPKELENMLDEFKFYSGVASTVSK